MRRMRPRSVTDNASHVEMTGIVEEFLVIFNCYFKLYSLYVS